MRFLALIFIFFHFVFLSFGQVPNLIKYQGVIRDNSGNLIINQNVSVKISIIKGSTDGTVSYSEYHTPTTNEYGLINLNIGDGVDKVYDISSIDWSLDKYFLEIEINGSILGATQILSVPYALHAKTAERITGTIIETDPVFGLSVANGITATDTTNWNNKLNSYTETQNIADVAAINNSVNTQLKNLIDPTDEQDAVTKAYVDEIKFKLDLLEELLVSTGVFLLDADNNAYKVVKIGNQVWMAENLKTTKYNDGTPIPLETNNSNWESKTTPAYCWYNNDETAYKDTYGALYNWYTVETGKLCPEGWHVPSDDEWTIVEDYLIANGYNFDGSFSNNKIAKSLATATNWNNSTNIGSIGNTDYPSFRNKSNFSAVPAGFRDDAFYGIGNYGWFWSSDEDTGSGGAWIRALSYENNYVNRSYGNKVIGISVRCIKN